MNHSKMLKENDVVVFKKYIFLEYNRHYSYHYGDVKEGDIGLVYAVNNNKHFGYEIQFHETLISVSPHEIEKIGEL